MNATIKINVGNRLIKQQCSLNDSLVDIIEAAKIPLNLQCGGGGFCGKCKVILKQGQFLVNGESLTVSDPVTVLGCLTSLLSNCGEIDIPESSILSPDGQISTHFAIATTAGAADGYHLAIDIGTTTVAVILIEGASGNIVAEETAYNQQMIKGNDVSARISYIGNDAERLKSMQQLVIQSSINKLIAKILKRTNISRDDIVAVAVAANTVMSHIFLNLNPSPMGVYPFTPVMTTYPVVTAGELNLHLNRDVPIYTLPAIAGYLGGDIVADIYITDLIKKSQSGSPVVMIDLGTNSEIVLAYQGELFATSTAAGPAFEGSGVRNGSRALPGAIEKFNITEQLEFEYQTIGNVKPKSLCGSGIIDFIASGFRRGLINAMGRYDLEKLTQLNRAVKVDFGENRIHGALVATEQDDLIVTEFDIEQILKAKAAIFSGLKILLAQHNLTFNELSEVILSGGFAKYIDLKNSITLGLLPNIAIDKFSVIGNGALTGAYLALQKPEIRQEFNNLITTPQVIELNQDPSFEFNYIDALMLPS